MVRLVVEKYDNGFRFYYVEPELAPNPLGVSKYSYYVEHNAHKPTTFFVVRELQKPIVDKAKGTAELLMRVLDRVELFPYKRFYVRNACELFIKLILLPDIANDISGEDFDVEDVLAECFCRDICWGFVGCSFSEIIGPPSRNGRILEGCLR
jgi:hypothetical protein